MLERQLGIYHGRRNITVAPWRMGGMTEGDHPLLDLNLKYLRCMRDFYIGKQI